MPGFSRDFIEDIKELCSAHDYPCMIAFVMTDRMPQVVETNDNLEQFERSEDENPYRKLLDQVEACWQEAGKLPPSEK